MATSIIRSVKGRKIRATQLDPCGVPTGECVTVVSSGFVSVSITGSPVTGRTYESRDIWGNLCVVDADPDEIRSAQVQIDLCDIDPDLLTVMTGREPVLLDGEAIGVREGIGRNWGSFALEVWTKALDDCDTWGYLLIPYIRNGRLNGEMRIQNGPLTVSVTGQAYPSYGWNVGPYGDNPFRVPFSDGDIYGMVVTPVAPPADQNLALCPDRLLDGAVFWIDSELSDTLTT